MATRLSKIRLFPGSSRSSKKKPVNRASSPAKKSMPTAHPQRTRMAHSSAQSQQTGTRRPYYNSDIENNDPRECPGGARPLPTPPRSDHYQDWHRRDEQKVIDAHPRAPLQEVDANARRATPRGPRSSMEKTVTAKPQVQKKVVQNTPQKGMSEMHSLIDDYLAWNNSASDLGHGSATTRPASSGTMFVDFATNGEMEVSYRKGVNKKLPVPPPPSKVPTRRPSKPAPSHPEGNAKPQPLPKKREVPKTSKPLPPPPQARHDSGTSCNPKYTEQIKTHSSRPLPHPPAPMPRLSTPQGRKSYPPQVHRTQRSSSSSAPAPPPHSSPALSHASVETFHTAPSSRAGSRASSLEGEAYRVIEPDGMTVHVQPSFRPAKGGSDRKSTDRKSTDRKSTDRKSTDHTSTDRVYVEGYDPATNYSFHYNAATMHVRRDPTVSRPESWTSEYFDVAAAGYTASTCASSADPSHHNSMDPAYYPVFHASRALAHRSARSSSDSRSKPLPPLPHSNLDPDPYPRGNQIGYTRLPSPPCKDAKKRKKVFAFVQKVMKKLDEMGVMKELAGHGRKEKGRGKRHSAPVRSKEDWVAGRYVV